LPAKQPSVLQPHVKEGFGLVFVRFWPGQLTNEPKNTDESIRICHHYTHFGYTYYTGISRVFLPLLPKWKEPLEPLWNVHSTNVFGN